MFYRILLQSHYGKTYILQIYVNKSNFSNYFVVFLDDLSETKHAENKTLISSNFVIIKNQ